MRVWRNRQVVTDVDDKRTTQTLWVTRLIEIYGHVKFESSSYLRKTLRVLHITPSLRVLRATEKEPNSFSESQWSNFICNDSAHIWWVWSAGGWRAGFSWNLHAPTNPRFPDRGKYFPLNSQKRGRLKPGRQRRHTGAGSPSGRRRRGEGSNGSPGTQEAPSSALIFLLHENCEIKPSSWFGFHAHHASVQ